MKISRLLMSAWILSWSFAATAETSNRRESGNDVGNGGDAIVCRDGSSNIKSVELFDVFEGRERRGLTLDLRGADKWAEKVELAIERIEKINPHRAQLYRAWLQNFRSEADYLAGIRLVDIPDTGDGWIPVACTIEQIAVRRDTDFANEKRYVIDHALWSLMDEDNKAALVLHELILREMMTNPYVNHRSSIYARYYNEMVLADRLKGMTLKQYLEFIGGLHFPTGDVHGFEFVLNDAGRAKGDQGLYKNFVYYNDQHVQWLGPSESLCSAVDFKGNKVMAKAASSFSPLGFPNMISFQCEQRKDLESIRLPGFQILPWHYPNHPEFDWSVGLHLDDEGDVTWLDRLYPDQDIHIKNESFDITVFRASTHKNGQLSNANLLNPYNKNKMKCGGEWRPLKPFGLYMVWDEQGRFVSASSYFQNYTKCEDIVD